MCFLPKATSVSRRRRRLFQLRLPPAPLAVLDPSQPGERQAHNLMRRLSTGRGASWRRPQDAAAPYSLAEVSMTEPALCWRAYQSADAARQEMDRRCATVQRAGGTP